MLQMRSATLADLDVIVTFHAAHPHDRSVPREDGVVGRQHHRLDDALSDEQAKLPMLVSSNPAKKPPI